MVSVDRELARTPEASGLGQRPLGFHAARIALGVSLAVLTYLLFPASPAVDFPVYEVGSVASDNVIAPFAFRVLKTDAELRAERDAVLRGVEPVYDFVPAAADSARQSLTAFSAAIAQAANSSPQAPAAAIQRAAANWGLKLNSDEANYLATDRHRTALFGAIGRVFDRWLSAGVASAGAFDSVRGEIVVRSRGEDRRLPADSVATFNVLVIARPVDSSRSTVRRRAIRCTCG